MPFAEYWEFRPSMLRKTVPSSPEEWARVVEGEEIPHPKVLMSTSQIIGGVSQKDPENFLIDMFRRKALDAAYLKLNAQTLEEQAENAQLETTLRTAIGKLEVYGRRITAMNKERLEKGQTQITWMHPAVLQASLNI
jgi:hypothetical protein